MDLVPRPEPGHQPLEIPQRKSLVEHFLSGLKATTTEAYRQDLEAFAAWLKQDSLDGAARVFFAGGHQGAHAIALEYRAYMIAQGYAAATVNRRLASLRSLVKVARLVSGVTWRLEIRNVPSRSYRDTRGPGREGYLKLLGALDGLDTRKARRDRAILHLLFDAALRRAEVVRLDVEDFDPTRGRVRIMGKGRHDKEWITIPDQSVAALEEWIEARGSWPGPLFVNFNRAKREKGGRLGGKSVWRIVSTLGKKVGVEAWPHGLRHASITEVLDGGVDVREAKKFSRHARIDTLLIYDDSRQDVGGKLAQGMADRVYGDDPEEGDGEQGEVSE